MVTRLSRKAQDHADTLAARMSAEIRRLASMKAEREGREFATEGDVQAAYQGFIHQCAGTPGAGYSRI